MSSEGKKKVILSCAQPTGKLSLGNYLGAVRNWAEMLEKNECFFGIVDLHAITMPHNPQELEESTLASAALYLAAGMYVIWNPYLLFTQWDLDD